jgi:hypothetical protein
MRRIVSALVLAIALAVTSGAAADNPATPAHNPAPTVQATAASPAWIIKALVAHAGRALDPVADCRDALADRQQGLRFPGGSSPVVAVPFPHVR